MPTGQLEHVNISVSDPARTADLLDKLAGWQRRWEGPAMNGGHTIHCGTEDAYVALYTNPQIAGGFAKGAPMNHIGISVDDLDVAERVVVDAGLEPFSHSNYQPGPRSFYFFDWDHIEWEVVSYA
jgi:catechol 2,3-dioxygenase-like lactoylglutathione lyase family enzyme